MRKFLKIFIIIISLSVISLIGISKVSAEDNNLVPFDSYPDINTINLNGIQNLNYATSYYVVGYSSYMPNLNSGTESQAALYLVFFRDNAGYIYLSDVYNNEICSVYTSTGVNGCFFTIWGFRKNTTNVKLSAVYYSLDNGDTWIYKDGSHDAYNVTTLNSYLIKSTTWIRPYDTGSSIYNNQFELDLPNLFDITYEQGEVIMSNYEGSSANLVSQYIETDENPQDYIFSYYYNTGGGLQNVVYEPTCTENLVDNHIHYSCYYNLPLFYNTILTFNIDNKATSNSVYSFVYNAYLSILPDSSYYNTYRFTGYKYANISGIDTGTFGLSQYTYTSILHDNKTEINYDIYVYDSSTGTKEDFITSSYYVSTNIDNNVIYRTFDFNGNSNLYLTIVLNDYIKYIDFDSDIYLFSPNTAYTHLSNPVECYNTEDISTCEHLATLPENQQSYKDSNNNTVNESNPINYYDTQDDFFNQLDSLFGSNQSFNGLTGIISSPLNLIRNLTTSNTCSDINLPIPYVNKYITLPCMSSIYFTYFGDFFTLYQSVTFAIIGYFVIIKFIATIKDLYNPDNDKIEVVDL